MISSHVLKMVRPTQGRRVAVGVGPLQWGLQEGRVLKSEYSVSKWGVAAKEQVGVVGWKH